MLYQCVLRWLIIFIFLFSSLLFDIRSGAIESFHIAIALGPEFVRATYYFNLGYAHSELRSWNDAIEALQKAIQLKPRKHVFHNLVVRRHTRTHAHTSHQRDAHTT